MENFVSLLLGVNAIALCGSSQQREWLRLAAKHEQEQAERRAFEAATGVAWGDRYKPVRNLPSMTAVDVLSEIEKIRGRSQ